MVNPTRVTLCVLIAATISTNFLASLSFTASVLSRFAVLFTNDDSTKPETAITNTETVEQSTNASAGTKNETWTFDRMEERHTDVLGSKQENRTREHTDYSAQLQGNFTKADEVPSPPPQVSIPSSLLRGVNKTAHHELHHRNASDSKNGTATEVSLSTKTAPPPRTLGYFHVKFISGFRNEGMVFTGFVLYAVQNNFQEILIETINWKNLYGKSREYRHIHHSALFDVEHWNSFYPALPRLVHYDPAKHPDFNGTTYQWNVDNPVQNAKRPYAYGTYNQCWNGYKRYTKMLLHNSKLKRDPAEVLMMQGAFRPSPNLQQHLDKLHSDTPYLALHARVEPDMQSHPVCRWLKVVRLQEIIANLERQFPEPPAQKVFIAINRPMLEDVVANRRINNTIAEENLLELNRISREGLWNGTVPVFEAGQSYILKSQSEFGKYSGISGAVVDYFLAKQAKVFVGTEVSSFSSDLVQSRFFSDNRQNYFYRPDGLHLATPSDARQPPRFDCR